MKRLGVVLVFHADVTKEEAAAALAKIADVVDEGEWYPASKNHPAKAKDFEARVQEYDDEYGGPVWYIP